MGVGESPIMRPPCYQPLACGAKACYSSVYLDASLNLIQPPTGTAIGVASPDEPFAIALEMLVERSRGRCVRVRVDVEDGGP